MVFVKFFNFVVFYAIQVLAVSTIFSLSSKDTDSNLIELFPNHTFHFLTILRRHWDTNKRTDYIYVPIKSQAPILISNVSFSRNREMYIQFLRVYNQVRFSIVQVVHVYRVNKFYNEYLDSLVRLYHKLPLTQNSQIPAFLCLILSGANIFQPTKVLTTAKVWTWSVPIMFIVQQDIHPIQNAYITRIVGGIGQAYSFHVELIQMNKPYRPLKYWKQHNSDLHARKDLFNPQLIPYSIKTNATNSMINLFHNIYLIHTKKLNFVLCISCFPILIAPINSVSVK